MDRDRKRSRHHFEKEKPSINERERCVVWEDHRSSLDELFFRNCDLIKRGSQEYKDFWLFLERYEAFHNKRHVEKNSREKDSKDRTSSKLGLPISYDRRYKINVALLSKDVRDVTGFSTTGTKKVYSSSDKKSGRHSRELSKEDFLEFKSILLFYIDFCQKQKFSKLVKLKKDQANLPISHFREQIVNAVGNNQAVIIAGDTGCGKSTQVPQYLLHAGFSQIACTQPRRIACISLAKRVGYETLNEYGSQVAYQIRFESSKTLGTRILFLTEGLLLRQLTTDPTLSQYSVIVVDEVHERHIHGDFLLGVLRGLLQARADLKLVLMSATINISLFSGYFTGAPVIQIPGRLYPIEVRYQPPKVEFSSSSRRSERLDPTPYVRIMQLIDHKYPSDERGDVLMFLSGMAEITAVVNAAKEYAQQSRRWIILALHSSLSVDEQDKVFDVAPEGVRKCVVSTNIAETSITIDGIRFIVDSGKVKEMSFDTEAKMQRLREFWISQASAEQRKGRAGRTGPGVCFRLYSENDYQAFSQYTTPEIQLVPLDSIILQMVALGINRIREFPFIEPPPASNVENSIHTLKQQGALTDDEILTPIGQMLAQLPVDVVIGKVLLIGSVFHVIEPVMIIAAALSVQSPFTQKMGYDSVVASLRQPLESDHGDLFTLLNAYDEWLQVKSHGSSSRQWCKRRGLEEQRFYEMSKLKRQFELLLRDHHLLDPEGRDEDEDERDREKDKRRELKRLKRDHRKTARKTKMLKLDEDELSGGEEQQEEETKTDIRDLEFKLTHDLDKLEAGSTARRSFTLRDINLLKIILCSGLYPNLALPDENNTNKRDSEQLFHSKSKQFLQVLPTSVFANRPQLLQLTDTSVKYQLLTYVSLLETSKPFLVNAMRVPALQTLLLFAHSLDTNGDLTRFVVDCWLEISLPDNATGQKVVSAVQQLRVTWARLLKLRFEEMKDIPERTSATRRNKELDLESHLANKLSEFLDSDVSYSLRRLLPSESRYLYLGPLRQTQNDREFKDAFPFAGGSEPHPTKGGVRVNEYLTYNCLQDTVMAEAASAAAQYIAKHWRCEKCGQKMLVTVLERLQHQEECQHEEPVDPNDSAGAEQSQTTDKSAAVDSSIERLRKPHFCNTCQTQFSFTSTEILKHKKSHAAASTT
ncbi:DEAH (Asp-Glu-Ala-His) box polypeptide 34 [Desmophyllum pertusum]|uniref:RNA helicase n=1 Tax=Desmophyllum pertusum TaxID=174260 RepID=A0A9X0A505_9CNID|nr:DEAH (Asp-Glu-Ala-His) box polypeptide 34 [Desmophyllum pertusum]